MTTAHCAADLAEIQRLDGELAKARKERDEAVREADRLRHGVPVEGDFVCPNEMPLSEALAEVQHKLGVAQHVDAISQGIILDLATERDAARAECNRLRAQRDEAATGVDRLTAECERLRKGLEAATQEWRDAECSSIDYCDDEDRHDEACELSIMDKRLVERIDALIGKAGRA